MTIQENLNRRTKSRTRVLMAATVISQTGSHQVLVRDISRHGARIYAKKSISEDHDVCFRRGPIFVAARIAWWKSGVAGLEFYRELTPHENQGAFLPLALAEDTEL